MSGHHQSGAGVTPAMQGPLERFMDALNRWIARLSGAALIGASLVLTSSVVMRYFLNSPSDWQDELSVFLIVGAVFMSSAGVQSVRGHVGIEAFAVLLPPGAERVRRWIVDLLSGLFCAYFSLKAWGLWHEAFSEGYRSGSSWAPPLWIPYLMMALGMSLLSVQIACQLVWPRNGEGRS
jgi:TRAP-type C4-dicarboxylate transport system permease small subunit